MVFIILDSERCNNKTPMPDIGYRLNAKFDIPRLMYGKNTRVRLCSFSTANTIGSSLAFDYFLINLDIPVVEPKTVGTNTASVFPAINNRPNLQAHFSVVYDTDPLVKVNWKDDQDYEQEYHIDESWSSSQINVQIGHNNTVTPAAQLLANIDPWIAVIEIY